MSIPDPSVLLTLLEKDVTLPEGLEALSARYLTAKPFPHLVLDGIFPARVLDDMVADMSEIEGEKWLHLDTEGLEQKIALRSAIDLRTTGFQLTALLHSAAFLYLLTALTGIRELLPDPYLQGGGYHLMPPGSFFHVHVDRNVAYDTGLRRRLAMIVFLNKAWKPEYGGHLELWSADGLRREVTIEPIFNRTVIFEVARPNYHGVPGPIACPVGRSRNSFLVYYHTVGTDGSEDIAPHSSIFAPRREGRVGITVRRIARECLPPIVFRPLRKLWGP
jgi:hypothetical protein